MRGAIHVFTFKEGLFARLAHDLRLSLGDWDATLAQGKVSAAFRLASLAVDGVAHGGSGGSVDAAALSAADKHKIHDNLTRDVLDTRAHPTATYEARVIASSERSVTLEGALSLHGVTRDCRLELRPTARAQEWSGEVTLTPSQFRIEPFKALAGAIRLADRVVVLVSLWLEGGSPDELARSSAPLKFAP